LRRALLALLLGTAVLFSLVLAASQVEQRLFRRRAELLLAEIQSLELRKTPWHEAKAQLERWRANTEIGSRCGEQWCSQTITLNQFVFGYVSERNVFVRLDDYFRWRLNLSYSEGPFVKFEWALLRTYMRLGGRPARVVATAGMRNGIVWSKGYSVYIQTYTHSVPDFLGDSIGYALMAESHSVPRFDYYGANWVSPPSRLHPDYIIGRPSGCEICVYGWAKFTPYADPADVQRLLQLDLSCLTRWHPCLAQDDIMPAAWAQHLEEQSRLQAIRDQLLCSPSIVELLGRDSANMVTGEIRGYRERVDNHGYHHVDTRVHVLERLKGAANWKVGETREVPDLSGIGGDSTRLQIGSRLIFFGGQGPLSNMRIDPGYGCPILLLNDTNLSLVRRGIAQDYTANDKAEQTRGAF